MPPVTGLNTAIDNKGFPFRAVRPRVIWRIPNQPSNLPLGPFGTNTKVIRVVTDASSMTLVYLPGVFNPLIVGRQPQDFLVNPGQNINVMLEPTFTAGGLCVTELV